MEPIPIAIVGLNFGRHVAREIAHGEAGRHMKLAAVCDIDEDKARQSADEFQGTVFHRPGSAAGR